MSFLRMAPRRIWSFLNIVNSVVPKNERKIFLYSNMGFRDNIRAVYDYLIENGYNSRFKIICSLDDRAVVKREKNVKLINNLRGLFSFFTCKYVFYCFGKYPVKPKRGQKVFNLWHGMPLKRIGNMLPGYEKTDYNYFTGILCTSEFFRDIMKKSFSCDDGQIIICGQPRTDEMIKSASVKHSDGDRLLLWLPTFRQGHADELDILNPEQFKRLDSLCGKYGWKVTIKLHPLSESSPDRLRKFNNISVIDQETFEKNGVGLYSLLGRADALITDYSSVYFDYLLLDRPIGFAVGDMKDYEGERGFTVDNPYEYMPGEKFSDGEGMLEFVRSVFSGIDPYGAKRREMNDIFNKYQDGQNCRRAVEAVGIR